MGEEVKALSIQQPWAWAIIHAGNDVENRDWYTQYRGLFLIHTGKRIDRSGYDALEDCFGITAPENLPVGGIVGQANLVDCVTKSDSRWFFGKYGFVLQNVLPLPFMQVRGQLGFFDVEYNAIEKSR